MIRELAEYDVDRYPAILRWPLAEALSSYEHRLREDARRQYQLDVTLFAQGGLKRKPKLPEILKD